ncbi:MULTISPECIES: 4'-phosphopantetheinyl transferase superfamily protein [unclassified Motilimonas]|uniref:4'-phosphopantetheinyl transferase family protein n=1 Tax=Motilimonas TaxID=1914248 RepID=UPI001E391B66|nr:MULTISPECIES: 4'-phosphopantetheinyl transferase superfamily protein [unclassified Motilimonas]MCE0556898.1 4'-phosphopantetheinyl transferase superfamily protein [Motilimonas sp. E26]MDO6525551.1 4'-phosphopantetheinyl transferase superfamily protein [Motilimonas sp. 1_MG-2023]
MSYHPTLPVTINDFIHRIETLELPTFSNLMIVKCHFDIARYQLNMFEMLGVDCPAEIANSVYKRQAEFLAGRFCSQQALQLLSTERVTINIGENRAPIWPDRIIGSIAHSKQIALAAVAEVSSYQYIGIDCEGVIDKALASSIASTIVTNNELNLLTSSGVELLATAVTIAFSSKEAMFKALYPKVGYYFDFSVAEIIKIDLLENLLFIQLIETLSRDYKKGDIFKCYFYFDEQHIISLMAQ